MKNSDKLAVIFPGMGYHSDKPLLYYSKKLARERGYDIVEVKYDFKKRAKDIMNDEHAMREAFDHAVSETTKQLSSLDFDSYKEVVFIGKSIGTTVAAYYTREHGIKAEQVVFTPVPATFKYLKEKSALVLHGTSDPWCETKLVDEKCKELDLQLYKVEGANHSLETNNVLADIGNMPEIVGVVSKFLDIEKIY